MSTSTDPSIGCRRPGARWRAGLAAAAGLAAYRLLARRRLLRWGATDHEAGRPMLGDDIVHGPHTTSTRALTIDALPRHVWPWLAQMGEGRGGLYSYDALDRLFGYITGPSADTVLPEFQDIAVGDEIPLGRGPNWPVVAVDRGRVLVIEPVENQVSWCFELHPVADGTRLVSRVRVGVGPDWLMWLIAPLVEIPWMLMERRMLQGIRLRAELLASQPGQPGAAARNGGPRATARPA